MNLLQRVKELFVKHHFHVGEWIRLDEKFVDEPVMVTKCIKRNNTWEIRIRNRKGRDILGYHNSNLFRKLSREEMDFWGFKPNP